jgi:hypothetical protein
MNELENRILPEPSIVYLCQSYQIVARADLGAVELRFSTNSGSIIAAVITGSQFARFCKTAREVLAEIPELANMQGERPH